MVWNKRRFKKFASIDFQYFTPQKPILNTSLSGKTDPFSANRGINIMSVRDQTACAVLVDRQI